MAPPGRPERAAGRFAVAFPEPPVSCGKHRTLFSVLFSPVHFFHFHMSISVARILQKPPFIKALTTHPCSMPVVFLPGFCCFRGQVRGLVLTEVRILLGFPSFYLFLPFAVTIQGTIGH